MIDLKPVLKIVGEMHATALVTDSWHQKKRVEREYHRLDNCTEPIAMFDQHGGHIDVNVQLVRHCVPIDSQQQYTHIYLAVFAQIAGDTVLTAGDSRAQLTH